MEEIKQLRDGKFVKLEGNTKRPFEKGWNVDKNYTFDEIKSHEGNIGFLCGSNNIYVIDIDDTSYFEEIKSIVGETFTVKTPNGYHFYIKFDGELKKVILEK